MKRWTLAVALLWLAIIYVPRAQAPEPPQTAPGPITAVPGTIQPPAPSAATTPAVAVTTVPSPASPQNPTDQIMWALAMCYALKYLTNKRWFAFLTPESTARAKAAVGGMVALGTAAGIHFAVNGSPFDGHGASITITGLSFDVFKDVGFQWIVQQGWYDALVKDKPDVAKLVAQLQQAKA